MRQKNVITVGLVVALVSLSLSSVPSFADPTDVLQKQCVILKTLVYVEYECKSYVTRCGTTWPFGLDELQLWHYQKVCQWWACDPVVGWLCTPVSDPWIDREWDRVSAYFRGCGCDPGGDPIPFFVQPPTETE